MCQARRSKAKKEEQALIDPHGAFRSAPSIRVSNFGVPVAAYNEMAPKPGPFPFVRCRLIATALFARD
jgi:hypothetical protein